MLERVLIANRGAIACRIIRTLHRLGIEAVAVYTRADAASLHVRQADRAVLLGDGPAADSYLDAGKVLAAARDTGAQAIHPGYGFLSENAAFAEACAAAGIAFLGPTPEQLRGFGLKHTARELAAASGVPLLPGSGLLADADEAVAQAAHVGYPVMLKSTAGGGGIGMQICHDADAARGAWDSVARLARNNFSDAGIFLEKYVGYARHVEVQIFGDGAGGVLALGERDCSVQRRNQKVLEETPAPGIPDPVRRRMRAAAIALGERVGYRSAGTVEFVYDGDTGDFYFLEVNTRLQVEHGVTEAIYGVDLVEWMVLLAAGALAPLDAIRQELTPAGHALQARVYAEDPAKGFQPATGELTHVAFPGPELARVETWVEAGVHVPPYYDPMLAKIIVHGVDRDDALARMDRALAATRMAGLETNLAYLGDILRQPAVRSGQPYTRLLETMAHRPATVDVLDGGTQTTIQDWPGRVGYWDVGVPPSGPMDDLSPRLANRLVGNAPGAPVLEITVNGPTLRFNTAATVALGGAPMTATLDGAPVPFWAPVPVAAGAVLDVGGLQGGGARAYLAVGGGLDVPEYLGSRGTFTLGNFGGHAGRALRAGDVLHLGARPEGAPPPPASPLAPELRPAIGGPWELRVVYGPHGAPDFFTPADMDTFFATAWEVHYNSSRTGVRLVGPQPEWARADGGEAGLHPSNIHDNAYAVGTVDFTGNMPVILGPDGPSLGGFVCPATVIRADRWKLGQLVAGDTLRFVPVGLDDAVRLQERQQALVDRLQVKPLEWKPYRPPTSVLREASRGPAPEDAIVYRPSGDDYLLVEMGPMALDIGLRARVHALMTWLRARAPEGILELTPGIRSLQVHYDPARLPLSGLMDLLTAAESELPAVEDLEVPSRIVHLPLSWDDPATRLAIEKYLQSVRRNAPWGPSNIEFIRRVNGLDSIDEVRRILFEASYLVLGLGDVYLGAPVATPVDPRHRLVTTKYNPARTWTPENAVGIGGSYLCVYGMEGPGGYQFVGRTLQMWNRYRQTGDFVDGKPWLLRFFDQLRFFPVSHEELTAIREDFPLGRYRLQVEHTTFSLRAHRAFLAEHAADIARFRAGQQAAFRAERERWEREGLTHFEAAPEVLEDTGGEEALPAGALGVDSTVAGSVWQVPVAEGERVAAGQPLVVVESMKMEIAIEAPQAGTVRRLLCQVGTQVTPGRRLLVLDTGET